MESLTIYTHIIYEINEQLDVFINLHFKITPVKLSTYIYKLILENDTVIVPGFGAFISEYQPAMIDFETAELKPPSKRISFSPKIRYNDGLLTGYISENEGISDSNALELIEKECDKILYLLDKGTRVNMEGIGSFLYNENQEIEFEPAIEGNLLLDSFGLEAASLQKKEEIKLKKVPEKPVSENELYEEMAISDNNEEITSEENKALIENEIHGNDNLTEILIPEPEFEKAITEGAIISVDLLVEEETERRDGMAGGIKSDSDIPYSNRRSYRIWYLLLLVPTAIAVFFVSRYLQNDSSEKNAANEKQIIEQKEIQNNSLIDSLKATNTEVTAKDSLQTEIKPLENQGKISFDGNKYFLIGGGFESEENLEKYISQMKEKGIECIRLGKYGRLNLAGIGVYNTEQDATRALNEYLKSNPNSEV